MLKRFPAVHDAGQRTGPGRGSRNWGGIRRCCHLICHQHSYATDRGVVGKPDFSAFYFSANGAVISYGVFLNALIAFLLVAAAVYFFMIAPMNAWKARAARNAVPADPASKKCPECLSEIPIAARRCAFCTSVLGNT